MKPYFFLLTLSIILIVSCKLETERETEVAEVKVTPEVLSEDGVYEGYSSKRLGYDMVESLFQEALQKNKDLTRLIDQIEAVRKQKTDSLKDYYKYINNNNKYWKSLEKQSSYLKDTLLRETVKKRIKRLKRYHDLRNYSLRKMDTLIQFKQDELDDLVVLMKIMVTETMMENYQENKFPDIDKLEQVKKAFENIIIKAKPFTEIHN